MYCQIRNQGFWFPCMTDLFEFYFTIAMMQQSIQSMIEKTEWKGSDGQFKKWNLYCVISRISTSVLALMSDKITYGNTLISVNTVMDMCSFKGIRWCLRRPVDASLPPRTVMMDQSVGARLYRRHASFLCEIFHPVAQTLLCLYDDYLRFKLNCHSFIFHCTVAKIFTSITSRV